MRVSPVHAGRLSPPVAADGGREASTPPDGMRSLLPDLLTLTRLPLAAMVWIAPADVPWVLGLILLAAVTDLLDGSVARRIRRRQGIPETGESRGVWLDPACDKAFVISTLTAVSLALNVPVLLALLVVTREWIQIPIGLLLVARTRRRRGSARTLPATVTGKAATVAQFLALGVILLVPDLRLPAAVAAAGLGGLAALDTLLRFHAVRTAP